MRDANKCYNALKVEIPYPELGIPNYFTPNGDGINDLWTIENIEKYPNAKIIVYDRYGKVLVELGADAGGWDGTRFGNPLPDDSYWYVVVQGFEDLVYKGHVTIIR